jgi:selenocysteine-specific elongation factor
MRVVGTAGHVDHGKSTLVEALTGINPDRLKEERERQMTIDLGFAWLKLPGGEEVGIVDVPGHRDFIENMLAGVGGIDAALFVIAADEGVMPQTREHLAILDILQIKGGVIALTKIDLVPDKEWLDLIEEEVNQTVAGTVLDQAPIVRVSARQGAGLDELLSALSSCLSDQPPRPDLGRPRLPIDRVFSIAGFGTVVTGTLSDGSLYIGEEVEILPRGIRGRIRSLQTHKRKEEVAVPGSRTAVNLSGVNLEQVNRGDVICHPGDYRPTQRLDVRFRLLPDASRPLEHNTEVKLYLGAAEVVARVRLIGKNVLLPGEEGWLQLEVRQPVVAVRGDRYILRRPSPGETLGGGSVLDPHPKGRHKRFSTGVIERYESLAAGTPADILLQTLAASGAALLREVIVRSNLEKDAAEQALADLLESGEMVVLDSRGGELSSTSDALVIGRSAWERQSAQAVKEVEAYHRSYPLRRGMPREELKSRLKLPPRLFNASLEKLIAAGSLLESGPLVFRPGHTIRFTMQQEQAKDALLRRFAASPYTPPSIKECQAEVGVDVFDALVDLGVLHPVSSEVVFRQEDFERMLGELRMEFAARGKLTAAEVRDHFNTSRKYVLALLEHLDEIGVTVREGDVRRLK